MEYKCKLVYFYIYTYIHLIYNTKKDMYMLKLFPLMHINFFDF